MYIQTRIRGSSSWSLIWMCIRALLACACMYVYVCIYVCMCVFRMDLGLRVPKLGISMHVHTYMCLLEAGNDTIIQTIILCIHTYQYVIAYFEQSCAHTYMYIQMCPVYLRHIHTYVYIYIHTHIHIRTHIHTCRLPGIDLWVLDEDHHTRYICTHKHIYAHMCSLGTDQFHHHVFTCTHTQIHAHMCSLGADQFHHRTRVVCNHVHTYTYTCTHVLTWRRPASSSRHLDLFMCTRIHIHAHMCLLGADQPHHHAI